MTEYDTEIINYIREIIITYDDNSIFYKILEEKYPIGRNRIDWSNVLNYFVVDLSDISDKSQHISDFFNKMITLNPEIIDDTVIVWGDETIENAYQMRYIEFEKIYMKFFFLPQHTYVWLENTEKLINYTFEDELYYG